MKTALQHFNELPSPYGQMAIEETIRQGKEDRLKWGYESASKVVNRLFIWYLSEMGYYFWDAIYDNLQHLESQSKQDKG